MRINFLCNYVNGGWKPTDTRLGGTEESIVEWTKELTKRGHEVTIYDNDNRDSYNGGGDICINIKSSEIEPKEPTLYLTNETNATELDLSKYLGVIWPSKWAVDNIPVNNKTFILPHGYDDNKISPHKKIKKQCLYASSPDRGLSTLLDVWPQVYAWHPDATLIITYGGKVNLPGVINMGEVDEETMNDLYNTSDYWLHPCNGGELYCISGIKAQAAGCIPVIIPRMALAETVRHGFVARNEAEYDQVLMRALDNPGHIRKQLAQEHYPTWSDSTDMLLKIIGEVVN